MNDETSPVVGKVFKHLHSNRGIWIPSNGGELNFLSYEILTSSCKDGPSNFPNFIISINVCILYPRSRYTVRSKKVEYAMTIMVQLTTLV
ncbi:unnamed protein product [Tenebrio molitor]|nr:unnamed protein product [Tenebrio molitor]